METIAFLKPKLGFQLSLPCRSNVVLSPVTKLYSFPLTSVPGKRLKHICLKVTKSDSQESNRKFKKLPPSEWTHYFHSVPLDVYEMDALRREIDTLKPNVKDMFMSSQGIERILIIYLLVSLGLAYHFEDEIHETLSESFENIEEMMAGEEDLYTVSIIFWVFRTYGHYISSDVFERFKGIDGNFKESLNMDAKGILSLYEAAHMRTKTDSILEEALRFTSGHLESLAEGGICPLHLSMRIRNALTLSQRWNVEIVANSEYIASYEQDKEHDELLLKFAKLSFKFVQLQFVQELKILTEWYKEQEFASKFPPYFRDRIVENHFFVLAMFFEPQLSRARIMLTQFFTILEIVDDTFDRYASLTEAECLTNSLESWAPDHAMDQQPDYLKFVFKFILDTFEEFERELEPERNSSYYLNANIEEFKAYVKANFDLVKWALAAHVPSFEEYMEVGGVEVAACAILASSFMCSGSMCSKEAYAWLKARPKLVQCLCTKGRLMNDIPGYKDDMSRGFVPNAVNCYMKQYGVTKEEAEMELHEMVIDNDKAINEELLRTKGVPHLVLKSSIGLAKMITISYNGYEGFTDPEGKIKEYMTSMYVDLIRL